MYRATAVGVLAKRMVIRMGSESCSEVIEVGAGELLRLGGEGLVLLPDTRRRRRWVLGRELVGSGQASFLSIFVAGLLEY